MAEKKPIKKHGFWDMFALSEGGRLKSTFWMYSFALGLLFLVVFIAAFVLLIDPLEYVFVPVSAGLAGFMECLVPALAGAAVSLLCQKVARNKWIAPAAYAWLAIAALAIVVIILVTFTPEAHGDLLSLIGQLTLLPILLGGGSTALVAYLDMRRAQD